MTIPGEAFALGAATCWAIASIPFSRVAARAGAPALNAFKTAAAALVLVPVTLVASGWHGASPGELAWLAVSGVLGLAVADTALFRAYALIGPRVTFVLFALSPFVATGLAWAWLGERPGDHALLGIAVTTTGIALVASDRRRDPQATATGATRWLGIACGLAAATTMGVSVVVFKIARPSGVTMPTESAHAIRMAAGAAALVVAGLATGRLRDWARAMRDPIALRPAAAGVLIAPILGVWCLLLALGRADAGVAMTLATTTPVLVIPLAWIWRGDRPGPRGIFGAAIAVAGVALLFASR